MRVPRWVGASIVVGAVLASLVPGIVIACSPSFEEPTIRALGPGQVVVVGTIGEKEKDGRIFHVERWFNGQAPTARIVIAFKEGEPVGDCSYPVSAGQRLIIAPDLEADGRLSANLVTLQADPATDRGRAYLAEATDLFGPGVIPPPAEEPPTDAAPVTVLVWVVGVVIAALLAVVALHARRRQAREKGPGA